MPEYQGRPSSLGYPTTAQPTPRVYKPSRATSDYGGDDVHAIREYYRDKELRETRERGRAERARSAQQPRKHRASRR